MKFTISKSFFFYIILLLMMLFIPVGCQEAPTEIIPTKSLEPLPTNSRATSKFTILPPKPTPTVAITVQSPTPSKGPSNCCFSPLVGIAIEDLPNFISNKFSPPITGSDNPHQGVDFSVIDQYIQMAISGNQVQSVLGGVVASVIQDRFPYGNAVLIETNLAELDPSIVDIRILPTPAPIKYSHPVLTCPIIDYDQQMDALDYANQNNRSLYLLYAHLEGMSQFQPGERVSPGQTLGSIGSSGNALNPHLHLELRVGQSNIKIPSMSHYHANASLEEMGYYCIWRISNAFQLVNPMVLFTNKP